MNLFKNIEMESQIQKTNIITREKTRGGINWDIWVDIYVLLDFPGGSDGKMSASKVGDLGSIPRSGRSPGEVNGNPLQYSCLENSMDGEAWWATVHGVAKSRTRLSDFTSLHFRYNNIYYYYI